MGVRTDTHLGAEPTRTARACHVLDEHGRALCLADVAGRPVHDLAHCRRHGHELCTVCMEAMALLGLSW